MSKKPMNIAQIAASANVRASKRDNAIDAELAALLDPSPVKASTPDPVVETSDHGEGSDAVELQRDNVAASERVNAKGKRDKVLPHDSIYLHPNVRKAIRLHALENDMKLQDVLRLAVQQYLGRNGIKFRNLETGERVDVKMS